MKKTKEIKVGIIGLGHQSIDDHIPAIKVHDDVEIVGVVDTDKQKVKDFIKENKGIKGYYDYRELFNNHKLDFIVIAVPHCYHYEITKKAIEKKINVLKEKPFVTSLIQAKKLKELAEKNDVKVMVTLQRRFNPIYSTFLQLINKIGSPFFIDAKYTFYTNHPHDGWRGDKKSCCGGCVMDMGYHMIDLLVWYFDLPDKVFAEMLFSKKENFIHNIEDTANIMFCYKKKNMWGSLILSRVIPPKQEYLNLYGTKGFIHLERGKIERYSIEGKLQESLTRKLGWPSAAQDQVDYFVDLISGRAKERIDCLTFHFKQLAFIEAAYKSKKIGKCVNPKELINI